MKEGRRGERGAWEETKRIGSNGRGILEEREAREDVIKEWTDGKGGEYGREQISKEIRAEETRSHAARRILFIRG